MFLSRLNKKKKPLQSWHSVSGERKIRSSIFPTLIIPSAVPTVKDYKPRRCKNEEVKS